MAWPDIFFKSRRTSFPPPSSKETVSRLPSRLPTISELEKSVERPTTRPAADKNAAESLRALSQSDNVRSVQHPAKESVEMAEKAVSESPASLTASAPPSEGSLAGVNSLRRRAKLTDVARILPKEEPREISEPSPPEAPHPVVPAAFPVEVTTGSVMKDPSSVPDNGSRRDLPVEPLPEKKEVAPDSSLPVKESSAGEIPGEPPAALKETTRVSGHEKPPASGEVSSKAIEPAKSDSREKQEFILANGERILGHILSETSDSYYLEHQTLGVLTVPRSQIAKKPIEVILINGDRIVGDLIAETSECLYVRHASLGMLTVPHNQRSTRVVEAILKDGDRILGEVLAETDGFTVIRSATLGTIAVQHEQVAMLNRKVEQMPLRTLPAPSPSLENKKE